MEYVNLGKAGVKVSRICLGCLPFGNDAAWKIELSQAQRVVRKAIDLGINFFDTANAYSTGRSEEILGECLKGCGDSAVVATKVRLQMGTGPNESGLSRRHIMHQIRGSLKRLKMDCVDLYQVHRWDYTTPIEETMRTLDDVVHLGKAHYIGASSMFAWQLLKALYTSDRLGLERFVSMQNLYNLLYREEEREMIPLCKEEGIAIIPWSPLARGFLAGEYKRDRAVENTRFFEKDRLFTILDYDIIETVEQMAKEKELKPAQVALAWLLHKGVTSPIIGTTRTEHVEDAVRASEVKLDSDEMERLERGYKPHPVVGHS